MTLPLERPWEADEVRARVYKGVVLAVRAAVAPLQLSHKRNRQNIQPSPADQVNPVVRGGPRNSVREQAAEELFDSDNWRM